MDYATKFKIYQAVLAIIITLAFIIYIYVKKDK